MKNNLAIINTGLDHVYLNGIPIIELPFTIDDIIKEVGRLSSLAVQADPYFNDKSNAQKLFSEIHAGDRTTMDFMLRAARDLSPIFIPYQRQMPEGVPSTQNVEYELTGAEALVTWTNSYPSSSFINEITLVLTAESGSVNVSVNGVFKETVVLNGTGTTIFLRDYNNVNTIDLEPTSFDPGFTFSANIKSILFNSIGWVQALTKQCEVKLPAYKDDIQISYLKTGYTWTTLDQLIKVNGAILRLNSGSAYVTIWRNGVEGTENLLDGDPISEDYSALTDLTTDIQVVLRDPSDDFNYDFVINTELPTKIPSARFEFNSVWNPGQVIFRFQNMDNRLPDMKLNYTSDTLRNIRIDENTFVELSTAITNALRSYILKELYLAVGYDKKAAYYVSEYNKYRSDVKFWIGSEKGYQTQYHHAGV